MGTSLDGEVVLRKHGVTLWVPGHKTVCLLPGTPTLPVYRIYPNYVYIRDGIQSSAVRVPKTMDPPESVRNPIETYLKWWTGHTYIWGKVLGSHRYQPGNGPGLRNSPSG